MIKPSKLNIGDTVTTISLSGGSAGGANGFWRYNLAKRRLQEGFGLNIIEAKHSLKGNEYIHNNPESRAQDLMEAFLNKDVKAIFLNEGGNDALRILPYIDFNVIKSNPKIFLGFSDATVIHFMCYKAGLTSFYGPNVLSTISEPVHLHDYTIKWLKKVLFDNSIIGSIEPAREWTSEKVDWSKNELETPERKMTINNGYELLQGKGIVAGHLIGGCVGPIALMIKGTCIFPEMSVWEDSIIFFEDVPAITTPLGLTHMLKALAAVGVFRKAKGLIFGKPVNHMYYEEYKKSILQVIKNEEGLTELPILYNMNFGHTAPQIVLPYGVKAEINCSEMTFSILEAGVV